MFPYYMYVHVHVGGGQKVQVKNLDILKRLTMGRPKGTPLVTVSNHASCLDDPAIWGKLHDTCTCSCVWYTLMYSSYVRILCSFPIQPCFRH